MGVTSTAWAGIRRPATLTSAAWRRLLALLLTLLLVAGLLTVAPPQARGEGPGTITTLAGGGETDEDGPATEIRLRTPHGVVASPEGSFYVSERGIGNRVRQVEDGVARTVAGTGQSGFSGDGGPATEARLGAPWGLALDTDGNLYIADRLNHRVRKVDTEGIITTIAGRGVFASDGDGGPAAEAAIGWPSGLAFDAGGNLFVADRAGHSIRRIGTDGVITTMAGNPDRGAGFSGDGGPATEAQLDDPHDVSVDAAGNVYIADTSNHRIRKVDGRGIITTIAGTGERRAGGDGGPATGAHLWDPHGVTVDGEGNVFVADFSNHMVRRIDPAGIITRVAGVAGAAGQGSAGFSGDGGPAVEAQLSRPAATAIDRSGNLLIVDQNNFRVRQVEGIAAAEGPVFVVNSTDDEPDHSPGDGECSVSPEGEPACTLRAAIEEANAQPGHAAIVVPRGDYQLRLGGLTVSDDVTVLGDGSDATTIDAGSIEPPPETRRCKCALWVQSADVQFLVTLTDLAIIGEGIANHSHLTLIRSRVSDSVEPFSGAGINNDGTLNVIDSEVTNNQAMDATGGGIVNNADAELTIRGSRVADNTARRGGGIYNDGSLAVIDSTVSDNEAVEGAGGGIFNDTGGSTSVRTSDVSGNSAADGGAVYNRGGSTLEIEDSTFLANRVWGSGGAIYNEGVNGNEGGELVVARSTFQGNSSATGGGAIADDAEGVYENVTFVGNADWPGEFSRGGHALFTAGGTLTHVTIARNGDEDTFGPALTYFRATVANSVVADNVGGDCSGEVLESSGGNLASDRSCPFNDELDVGVVEDAGLGELGDHGGPTQTLALTESSPAVDAAVRELCLLTDQRGVERPQGSECDSGAFELEREPTDPAEPVPPAFVELELFADREVVPAGVREIPIAGIPLASIPLRAINSDGVDAAPLRAIGVEATPLRAIDIAATPLRAIPLRAIPLRAIPLRAIMLSQVPLDPDAHPGGWEALLAGSPLAGLPLQTITLDDVHDLGLLDDLAFGDLGLAATPLRAISLASIALGATPLRAIPLPEGTPPDGTWCGLLAELGFDCSELDIDDDSTVMHLDVAGVPIASTPLRAIPLRAIDLEAAPLRAIPLRAIEIAATPLRAIPLRAIAVAVAPLRAIPLRAIAGVETLVDCSIVDCENATLGDAADADAILEDALLGDLGEYGDTEIGDLIEFLPEDFTLADILLGLLLRTDFPWEQLPLGDIAVQEFAGTGENVRYTARFQLGAQAELEGEHADTTVTVTLPEGFWYAGDAELRTSDFEGEGSSAEVVSATVDDVTVTFDLGRREISDFIEYELSFDAAPGLRLGGFAAAASLDASGFLASVENAAPVSVAEHFEPENDDPESAPVIAPDVLYVTHISSEDDIDFFRVPAPPKGSRLQVHLSHLSEDKDLVLYSPVEAAPLRAIPLRAIPLRAIPLDDAGADLRSEESSLPPEGLRDIPLRAIPLRAISANRGTTDELVETTSRTEPGDDAFYTIQVTGYNGAHSPDPYVLRVRYRTPPEHPPCGRTLPFPQGAPGTMPAVPDGTNTLFVVNERRFRGTHGADAATEVMNALAGLAGRSDLGVQGAVVPVDAVSAVRDAFAAWDAEACDPERANEVVGEIIKVLDALRTQHPTIENVVLVGADDILPMGRVPDNTTLANERDYSDGVGGPNPLSAAFYTEHVLTDGPYGDGAPTPWLDRALYVPDVSVGRLVESPADILAQVELFIDSEGRLDPQTALTTGYDFLTHGAEAIDAALGKRIATRDTLIDDSWTRQHLIDALFAADESPDVAAVNAHFDHYRSLPALPDALGHYTEEDLFTIDDVEAGRLAGRILFSMGCHSALSVPDLYVTDDALAGDWPQVFSGQRAIYVGNTGFGYGHTDAVALSERLMELFAEGLDGGMSAGEAFTFAKHAYAGEMGVYGPYDEKALMESTFYGLPMYEIGDPVPAPEPPVVPPVDVDPVTGLPAAPATVESTFRERITDRGRFWEVEGADTPPQVTHFRPIQPRTAVDVTQEDLVAQGAIITDMETTDVPDVNPVFARPTIDHTEREPEFEFRDVAFPAYPLNLTTFDGREDRRRHNLVVMPGQFFSGNPTITGTQRLFERVDTLVYYAEEGAEHVQPEFRRAEAVTDGEFVRFDVDVVDQVELGEATPSGTVTRVLVLFRDATGEWQPVDLTHVEGSRWSGGAAVTGTDVEFFAQAVDASGNTSATTNKGRYFEAELAPEPPPGLTVQLDGLQANPASGWYTGDVTVTVSGIDGVTVRVDGGTPEPSPVTITGDGVHRVDILGSEVLTTVLVAIDTTPPTAQAGPSRTFDQGEHAEASFSCADHGSGVASCTPLDPTTLDTSTPGSRAHGFRVEAIDVAGNSAVHSLTYDYEVAPAPLQFEGFFRPIVNDATNVVTAGSTVPTKFRVRHHQGDLVTDVDAVASIVSVRVSCETGLPAMNEIEEPAQAASSKLVFDSNQFVYSWRTDRSWSRTCRVLRVTLADNTVHTAIFQFR